MFLFNRLAAFAATVSMALASLLSGWFPWMFQKNQITIVCDGTARYKLAAEARDTEFDGNYIFAQYFEGGTQADMEQGIRELIAEGAVSINGIPLPASVAEMTADQEGNCNYVTNGVPAFTVRADASDQEVVEAGLAAVAYDLKSAGTNVTLELDRNGYAAAMSLFVTRGVLIDVIMDRGDGTSVLIAEGKPYSVSTGGILGGGESIDVVFSTANLDPKAKVGDIAVCYQDAEGWHLMAADHMEGYLVGGADHADYLFRDMNGTIHCFEDANLYQRSFAVQNRPGGFVNTQNRFKLTEKDYPVTAWFVPGTAESEKPLLIGFTTGDSARLRLADAIAYVENVADNAVVAQSRKEAGEGVDWVEDPAVIEDLRSAIAQAQAVYQDPSKTSPEVDGAVYQLQLALWGSKSDISAMFEDTIQEGFYDLANPNQPKAGPAIVR